MLTLNLFVATICVLTMVVNYMLGEKYKELNRALIVTMILLIFLNAYTGQIPAAFFWVVAWVLNFIRFQREQKI
jgi:hypothetical protein